MKISVPCFIIQLDFWH